MNKRTTAENHFQDVRLISFASQNLSWNPGDVLVVRPANSDEQVEDLFNIFQEHNFDFSAKTIINLTAIDSGKNTRKDRLIIFSFFFFSCCR